MTSIRLEDINTICLNCNLLCSGNIKICPSCSFKMTKTSHKTTIIYKDKVEIMIGI